MDIKNVIAKLKSKTQGEIMKPSGRTQMVPLAGIRGLLLLG
jgi:hypothetical protein